jgi:predicted ATP-grasp superfamily ATP-dependent carboligase
MVLVTDGHWRKSLAAVRGLGRKGVACVVGETTRLATAAFSKYCRRQITYSSPVFASSVFMDEMRTLVAGSNFRMLLPMEDTTVRLFAQFRDDFSQRCFLPVSPVEKIDFANRKDLVLQLARKMGIPTPKTWHITDLSQLAQVKDHLPYPMVVKPRTGAGALGIAYPETPAELLETYPLIHRRFPFPMIQEKIPAIGAGYGASFLMDEKGDVKASFVHKRLREYPVTGGASTLRESVRHDGIREMGQTLLSAMGWFGVAMVEFKIDPRDHQPKLMEVNPRFWGSLALSIAAGVNFPYLLYKMAKGERFAPVETYRTGIKCRWFLPGDLLHFIYNPQRRKLMPGFFNFRVPNTTYDILSRTDPLPALGRLLTPLTFLYDRDMKQRLRTRHHGR